MAIEITGTFGPTGTNAGTPAAFATHESGFGLGGKSTLPLTTKLSLNIKENAKSDITIKKIPLIAKLFSPIFFVFIFIFFLQTYLASYHPHPSCVLTFVFPIFSSLSFLIFSIT